MKRIYRNIEKILFLDIAVLCEVWVCRSASRYPTSVNQVLLGTILILRQHNFRLFRLFLTHPLTQYVSIKNSKIDQFLDPPAQSFTDVINWLSLNPNWHEGWSFYLLDILGSDFFQLIFFPNFPYFLEVKIDINGVDLTPCQAHWDL